VSVNRYDIVYGKEHVVPVPVLKVEPLQEMKETFDIEVADEHEFFCDGYLTHNSAENMLGEPNDEQFCSLKDPNKNREYLENHRWASNNSLFATVGMDYSKPVKSLIINGEPGFFWLDNAKKYSRLCDAPDGKDENAAGCNPCSEQTLESFECCCLCETYPAHHDSYEDFQVTLKYAYLYSKTVTLMPTHDPRTNAVMLRNRRIGTSMSGIVQAINKHGTRNFFNWCQRGYKYLDSVDKQYSDWLCVPVSKKRTSVKPSGTISLLCGATPGVHFPESEYYIRNIRIAKNSHLVAPLQQAGYLVEDDVRTPSTVVVSFPIHEKLFSRGKRDVTLWEQLELVSQMQQFWADNQVSATIHFQKHEAKDIVHALELYEIRLKGISFLPLEEIGEKAPYPQMPYIPITKERYDEMVADLKPYTFDHTEHEVTEKFCDGGLCSIR
jgi:adenosylcobalamin-dependent ribonucleoside-triphosphate reductase